MLKVPHILVLAVGWVFLGFAVSTQASNPADIFTDCKVDWLDLKMLADDWLWTGPSAADIDNSGDVNFPDFAILANNWGWTCPPPEMVLVPGGSFQMGDSFAEGDSVERPVHTVTLDSFYVGKYEVTNSQYCQYLNSALGQGLITVTSGVVYKAGSGTSYPYCGTSTSSTYSQIVYSGGVFSVRTKGGRNMSNDPMVEVSWYGSVAYCNWRSQQEGYQTCYNDFVTWNCDFSKHGYRLPTEAEWEYAARGGLSGKRFPWSDPNITHSQANYHSSSSYSYDISPTRGYHPIWNDGIYPYTSPVGFFDGSLRQKSDFNWPASQSSYQTTSGANGYGLYDMAGNVWEWCNDWYSSTYYSSSPPNNPTGPTSGSYYVLRGGCWWYWVIDCRAACRGLSYPYSRYHDIGFRVVLDFQ
jgi:formylglycine-generating enzyme required for sulfatase activity